jgi:hypothetical protein
MGVRPLPATLLPTRRRPTSGEDRARPVFKPYSVRFDGGRSAVAVDLSSPDELPAALSALGLAVPIPTLVLVGWADGLEPGPAQRLRDLFCDVLVPLLDRLGVALIDGGTEAGVMALIGRTRIATGGTFPLIGVAARDTVVRPDEYFARNPGGALLDPNHTHFILVPGERWGDESPWISDAAMALSGGKEAATLVAGGGVVTRIDVEQSLRASRPTILLSGSGGIADRLAHALCAGASTELTIEQARLAGLRTVALESAASELPRLFESLFTP